MPSIKAPAKILVTGANGFTAVWIIRTLLYYGYSVRGTVRAESKITHLRNFFRSEVDKGQAVFVVVPDMKDRTAFEEAVRGVDAILHTASPTPANARNPNEMIEDAVNGTPGILESVLKYAGPQLKRVVLTSTVFAVRSTATASGTFDESNWNEGCLVEVEEKGNEASLLSKYCASKTLAERAAWDFVPKHKSEVSWDLATICPPYVFGPILTDVPSPSKLNTSMAHFYTVALSEGNPPEPLASIQANWVDVRDVALGHLRALEVPEAGGERFILSKEPFYWQVWRDIVNELRGPGLTPPADGHDKKTQASYTAIYDATKSRIVLGLDYRDKRETLKDIIEDRKAHGW